MTKLVYGIEGLDRLGKSTLIDGILEREGFYQVIHFGKPVDLKAYERATPHFNETKFQNYSKFLYQRESFINSMVMARSGARIIFDRWHLGEAVYAPMYRAYPGDYVFDIEANAWMDRAKDVRLILLCEDFTISNHFKSDGESFDDKKREEEQELFLNAFETSCIRDKRIIWVTAADGGFRPKEDILQEALE